MRAGSTNPCDAGSFDAGLLVRQFHDAQLLIDGESRRRGRAPCRRDSPPARPRSPCCASTCSILMPCQALAPEALRPGRRRPSRPPGYRLPCLEPRGLDQPSIRACVPSAPLKVHDLGRQDLVLVQLRAVWLRGRPPVLAVARMQDVRGGARQARPRVQIIAVRRRPSKWSACPSSVRDPGLVAAVQADAVEMASPADWASLDV